MSHLPILNDIPFEQGIDSNPPALNALLDRLNSECGTPVSGSLARFSSFVSPATPPAFSIDMPTLFTRLDMCDFDSSYKLLVLLPVPSLPQLSTLRCSQQTATTPYLSIQLPRPLGIQRNLRLPPWIIGYWAQLHMLQAYAQSWSHSQEWLQNVRRQGKFHTTASRCLSQLVDLPLHSPLHLVPNFFTSDLPTFLGSDWLSDTQMNAGGHFINSHPALPSTSRVLDTQFLVSLTLHQQRSLTWSPSRPRLLDTMVADGKIKDLYIAVHEEVHWTYLRVNVPSLTYQYTNTQSLATLQAPSSTVDSLNWWLSSVLGKLVLLKPIFRDFSADRQMDSHSCGVAVLTTMAHQALGGEFHAWAQKSTSLSRMQWFLYLVGTRVSVPSSPGDATPPFDFDPSDFEFDVGDFEPMLTDTNSVLSTSLDDESTPPSSFALARSPSPEVDDESYGAHAAEGANPYRYLFPPACRLNAPTNPIKSCPTLTQTRLPFQRISRAEKELQDRDRFAKLQEQCQAEREREALEKVQAKLGRTTYERERKREQRTVRRAAQIKAGLRGLDGKLKKHVLCSSQHSRVARSSPTPTTASSTLAEMSRPSRTYKDQAKQLRRQRTGQTPSQRAIAPTTRVNWTNPLLWRQIEQAIQAVGTHKWSPIEAVRRLQQQDPVTFALLRPQRLSQWRDFSSPDVLKWKDSHLRAIERGSSAPIPKPRPSFLSQHPALSAEIKSHLANLRAAGVALHVGVIRGFMVAMIRHRAPEIFACVDKNGKPFQLSSPTVRRFLRNDLGWSLRRATRAAQKIPPKVNDILFRSFLRMACLIRDENIPACCIVNADQTQVVYSTGTNSSWNERGQRQVTVLGSDEKRAFTLLMGVSMSGHLLPPQAIYSGKSARSLPDASSPGFSDCRKLGIQFVSSMTSTYWSTLATMQQYITEHLAPYFRTQIEAFGLPLTQRCIFQIDCWSLHKSKEFRTLLAENYPWIALQYVPGGCTGLFQACDVGIQRIFKLAVRHASHCDIVDETMGLLQSGVPPSEVVNDTSLGTLRNRSVRWILEGYNAVNDPELVQKAFSLCAVPGTDFNLSHASLTSHQARAALLQLRSSDPQFYAEITSGSPIVISDTEAQFEDVGMAEGVVDEDDDSATLTVADLCKAFMSAANASEIASPNRNDSEDVDSDDDYAPPPITPATTKVARRITRRTSKH
ncbi:hypothetical protein FRC07_014300 [Ceratobasidium sp. 392]|nr:hypothetical protein FRC07_014300 [Ceratobasidium sp. 392]